LVSLKNRLFSLCQTKLFFNLTNLILSPIQLEHFRNLVSLSAIDGKIEEVERVALSKIAYEQDLPLDRLNLMLNRASEYIYLIPQNTEEKEKQLEQMIRLALVDDDFSPAELELIEMVSDRLGFSRKELTVILETHCGYKK
jgi:tellurite resistance protein